MKALSASSLLLALACAAFAEDKPPEFAKVVMTGRKTGTRALSVPVGTIRGLAADTGDKVKAGDREGVKQPEAVRLYLMAFQLGGGASVAVLAPVNLSAR